MSYARFGAMIVVSSLVMFGLMYLNTYALDHIWYSQTRAWMALIMGASMTALMLGFMWSVYKRRSANIAILAGAAAVFALSLYLVRSQDTVGDVSYMKAMIPHHSIAVMTSERANIRDERVRKLADQIIESQMREIAEMKQLIADLERNPPAATARVLPARPAE
jgi:Na+/proline symporter